MVVEEKEMPLEQGDVEDSIELEEDEGGEDLADSERGSGTLPGGNDEEKEEGRGQRRSPGGETGPIGPEDDRLPPNPPALIRTRSSSRPRELVFVPRSECRGLFARLTILPEVTNSYNYKNRSKWVITSIVAAAAAGGPMGSSIFYPALGSLARDLHTSPTIANLTVAFYMLAMSIFPLWWSAFSETLGRRTIYIISFALFVVFSVLSAVSDNIAMLIVMRILGGGASASVQAVGAGTIADIWESRERGRAMGIFYLGPLAGPMLSPIIGGALAERWGWKSTMWFCAIFGLATWFMIVFFLPETLARDKQRPTVAPAAAQPQPQHQHQNGAAERDSGDRELRRATTRQSVQAGARLTAQVIKKFAIDPLKILQYMRFPPVMLVVVYAAVTFGVLFVVNISTQAAFSGARYHFSELIVGLLYLPCSLGYMLASLLGGRWLDKIMAREARRAGRYDARGRLVLLPEDRMRENMWLAATLYPAAMILFGWTAQKGVFWLVPIIGTFLFGIGTMLIFGAATTMLTEFMPRRSSGGIALNNFVRNILSCIGAVIAQPLIAAMGIGWLCTMLALVTWVIGYATIWVLRRNGPRWRKEMDEKINM